MQLLGSLFWNRQERRLRALWRLVGLLLTLGLLALLLGLAMAALGGLPLLAVSEPLLTLAAVLAAIGLATRLLDRRPVAELGLHFNTSWWLDFGFGLLLGGLLMTLIFVIEWAAGWLTISETWRSAAGQPFLAAMLLPVVLFIVVGISEELLFRGYLLKNLAEGLLRRPAGARRAVLLAWLLSSIIFGVAHGANPNASLVSTVNLIVAGLFLGLGYILSGELGLPIGLHITWNFFQGHVFGFPVSGNAVSPASVIAVQQRGPELWTGGAFGPEAGLLGLLVMLLGGLLIMAWVRWRYQTLALRTELALAPSASRC